MSPAKRGEKAVDPFAVDPNARMRRAAPDGGRPEWPGPDQPSGRRRDGWMQETHLGGMLEDVPGFDAARVLSQAFEARLLTPPAEFARRAPPPPLTRSGAPAPAAPGPSRGA